MRGRPPKSSTAQGPGRAQRLVLQDANCAAASCSARRYSCPPPLGAASLDSTTTLRFSSTTGSCTTSHVAPCIEMWAARAGGRAVRSGRGGARWQAMGALALRRSERWHALQRTSQHDSADGGVGQQQEQLVWPGGDACRGQGGAHVGSGQCMGRRRSTVHRIARPDGAPPHPWRPCCEPPALARRARRQRRAAPRCR